MKNYGKIKGIHIDHIDGHIDHIHILISMKANQSIAEIVQKIKGESSYWINKNDLTEIKFGWQSEYYAASLSSANIQGMREYIKNQQKHHKDKSYDEEIEELQKEINFNCTGFKPSADFN